MEMSKEEAIKGYFGQGIKFFLNTSKRVMLTQNVIYREFKEELDQFEVVVNGDKDEGYTEVVIAKTKEDLEEFNKIEQLKCQDYHYQLGLILGYPETASHYYTYKNKEGDRYRITYHGLGFVCGIEDVEEVKKELTEMYGLPFDDNYNERVF